MWLVLSIDDLLIVCQTRNKDFEHRMIDNRNITSVQLNTLNN